MRVENAAARLELASDAAWRSAAPANRLLFEVCSFLFLVPNLLLALGLGAPAAALVAAGCALALHILAGAAAAPLLDARVDARLLAGCAALALALTILGGQGHIFYANYDWLVRDAVIADLSSHGLPIHYRDDQQDWLLRAPLGMYMLPALAGRAFGLSAAHFAMVVQNTSLLAIFLYFLTLVSQTRALIFATVFVFFGGLDIVPIAFWKAFQTIQLGQFVPSDTIEWWTQAYRGQTEVMLQYSSNVTQLFWAPNHTLAGWWFALLYLLFQRKEVDLPVVGVSFVALLAWSPLAMAGALPFLLLCGLDHSPRALMSARIFEAVLASFCFVPIALYLMIEAGSVPHRWLLPVEGFVWLLLLFLAVEIPHAAILGLSKERIPAADRRGLAVAVAGLVAIPVYSLGDFNDFALRVSIVPLCLLAFAFAGLATAHPRPQRRLWAPIVLIIVLGAIPPLLEIRRALLQPSYAISDCNLLTSWRKSLPNRDPANYFAPAKAFPAWLSAVSHAPPLELEVRKCWPDHPLLSEEMK